MLDNYSTGTFISEDAVKRLKIDGVKSKIAIKTMNGTKRLESKIVTGLVVSNLEETNIVQLPQTFTRDEIPAAQGEIPRPQLARQWSHLIKSIADKIQPYLQGMQIDLLIGTNCPVALQLKDFVTCKNGGPYGMLTFAGWTVVGPKRVGTSKPDDCSSLNRIMATSVCDNKIADLSYTVESQVKEVITPDTLSKLIDAEFSEASHADERKISVEDTQFIRKIKKGIQLVDGHYLMPLPFKEDDVSMPENKEQVKQKTKWLKSKLLRDSNLYEDYKSFMSDIIHKDYARKIPAHLLLTRQGKTWYIPHHGVYHPHKPDKIRVVFNCSAKYQGISLNDKLLQGPDLTNSLLGVLTRFRQKPIAFMGDIDAMFHQVRVNEDHRNFIRFLWWTDADLSCDPEEYQMNVHLFGAISSPSCANYAVKKIAEDFEEEIDKETAETLRKNFYVDDCLRSENTEEAAIQRVHDVMKACSKGGFSLSKIVSNKRTVIETIPTEKRSKALKNVDLSRDLPMERALGVHWCVETDELGFHITLKDMPLTRKVTLATISSVYDPLGIAAPVVLQGKKILQELCINNIDWDAAISDEYKSRWEKWRTLLPELERFTMKRSLKPENFGNTSNIQIHSFSDASFTGYGQVSYLRQTNDKGDIHCAFLMGKARLAPLKAVTVPRLELNAAVLSVRIGTMLESELDEQIDDCTYWTDSTTVLKYLNNSQNRYKIFMANRIQTIRYNTQPVQWRYVESGANPADDASRGLDATCLTEQHRWIYGPEFLWKSQDMWPKTPVDVKISDKDPDQVEDPFLDADGLMRVGGRLCKSQELSEDLKHPIILPKKIHITSLIIRDAHEKTAHSGRGITLNELRNHYWVINGNSAVRWFVSKCVVCRRLRATLGTQKMADLPEDRVTPAPPFTHCVVDYFGPCTIKEGRKELKRYGVLFTCLSSRAVHLESAISLETDSFLNALRRFIARRGPIKSMRSDQGTNLVGAVKELKENLKKMDQDRITEFLLRHGNADWLIKCIFNPPSASHMSGSWERLIRTVRSILVALVREYGHALNDEAFRTLLTEVESIVNSRPLTFPTDDAQDLIGSLTPNHLLTMKSKVALPPPGNFQREDMYCRKQWKRVQYGHALNEARIFTDVASSQEMEPPSTKLEIKVGDIVLITDERTPRNSWPLARVIEVFEDSKGLVRSVKIKTQTTVVDRPIHKLIVLIEV